MKDNPDSQEKKEMKKVKGSFFEVPGVPISEIKGESKVKPEGNIEEKKTSENSTILERKEPSASEFKAPGELETGYTEKSWAKPEKSVEEKVTERTEEVRQEAAGETREGGDREAREREAKEREAKEREAKEREAKEREAKERETREKETKEEKRTVYTMDKRLTKSKTDRKLFGVCGGLGEYFGIDPTLVRLAFVLLSFLTASGWYYILFWP